MLRIAASALVLSLSLACAGMPRKEPLPVKPLQPGPGEAVVVDHALLIFDASESICRRSEFVDEKALFESFVAGMPEGSYAASSVAFGGYDRQHLALAPFQAERLESRGFGESMPIAPNDTPENLQRNRRTELTVL